MAILEKNINVILVLYLYSKMKTHIDFVCPLPRQAIDIIKQIEPYSRHRSEFVFPSPFKVDRGISGAILSDTLN
ncbi:hypothetical protein CJ670_05150 [Arcobacter cryaerophilus gv. crypticus]|uniref:Uncharacterized protein n=2 Tax=Aliarcobacter cryaerophilus TaxID=28198 RepID=A0A2S9TFH1_9BACT|nr:hypothetical protein CJ670_05150 [Arcobacter cryaerophilus gv. crypticus]